MQAISGRHFERFNCAGEASTPVRSSSYVVFLPHDGRYKRPKHVADRGMHNAEKCGVHSDNKTDVD